MFGPFGQGSQGTHAIVADWRENCEGGDHHLHPNPLLGCLEPSRLLDTKEGWQDLQQRRSPGGPDNHRHITRFHKSSPLLNLDLPCFTAPRTSSCRIFQGAEPEQLVWGRGTGPAAEFSVGISIASARRNLRM